MTKNHKRCIIFSNLYVEKSDIMKKTDVWLDTDIGGDIDDALALALIIKSPEINLIGVTTAFNNAGLKARIARRMLDIGKMPSVPVYAGQDQPILKNRPLEVPCQYDEASLGNIGIKKNGVEEMAHAILTRDEKTTLVTIGPLTNVALMLMIYPDTKEKIDRIVMMGGNYYSNMIECNISEDALAADYVFRSGVNIEAVGTDVTDRVVLSWDDVEKIKSSRDPVCVFITELMSRWGNYRPTLHDPLAVMYILMPELCTMQKEEISVNTAEGASYGFTYNISMRRHIWGGEAEHPNVLAAKNVDAKRAVKFFMERLLG